MSLFSFGKGGGGQGQINGIFPSVNLTNFANFEGNFLDHRIGKKNLVDFSFFLFPQEEEGVCLCSTHRSLGVDYRIHINKMNNLKKTHGSPMKGSILKQCFT